MHIFLPILIMSLIVISIIVVIIRSNRSRKISYSSQKIYTLLAGYVGILFVSVVYVSFLMYSDTSQDQLVYSEDIVIEISKPHEGKDLYHFDQVLIEKQDELYYDKNELNIAALAHEYVEIPIVIDRKETNDKLIETTFYTGKSMLGEIDFTAELNPLRVDISDDTLTILNPDPIQLSYSAFAKEFPITQFTGGRWDEFDRMIGERILYLRIPKNVEISNEDELVNILYKKD